MLRKCVLVTRPPSQGEQLCLKLQSIGFTTNLVPVLTITPQTNPSSLAHTKTCFTKLQDYAGIIFVSLNAAEQSLAWLKQHPLHPAQTLFAVGKTTADFLKKSLAQPSIKYPEHKMDSEGLLSLPELQHIAEQHFLLLRGEGGRELIANTLQGRGASIDSCELYQRCCPMENASLLQSALPNADVIVINSVESLENFVSLTGHSMASLNNTLLVPSNRVVQAAKHAGFKHIICADNATDSAVISALLEAFPTGGIFS